MEENRNQEELEKLEGESGLTINERYSPTIYPNAEIRIMKAQYSILHVKRLCENRNELIISPNFQRNNVWKGKQQYELIESILMGIPIPVMYLFEMKDGTKQVVDGRQRITTILDFLNNNFKLKDLKILHTLNGSYFKNLDPKLQGIFEDYQLFFYIIQPPTPERVKYDIFDRVNRGGTNLNNQEMRNALYQGKATQLIDQISNLNEFKKATDHGVSPTRMRDKYVVLRAIAFYYLFTNQLKTADAGAPLEYKSDIDDFLAKVMIYFNQSMDEIKLQSIVQLFKKTFERIYQTLGKDAFRFKSRTEKRRPINMPLMESLIFLFLQCENLPNNIIIKQKIEDTKENLDQSGLFKGNVDSTNNWTHRHKQIENILNELQ